MLKFFPLLAAAVLALPVPLLAQDAGAVLRIIEAQDQIVRIQAKTRHTTVIVLPASENILDFVVGDSEYWHLTGAANLAFLKPIAEGVTTNVALVCESGRIYSFLVTEGSAGEPGMLTYSLYAVIAGCVLRVFSAVGIAYITTLGGANLDTQSMTQVGLWTLAVIPLFIAGLLSSLKCGELASMLVTGGGAGGSGLMGLAGTAGMAAASGGAAAAKTAASGGIK